LRNLGELVDGGQRQLELAALSTHGNRVRIRLQRHLLVGQLAKDRAHAAARQHNLSRLLHLDARNLRADGDLQVRRQQLDRVTLNLQLDVLQDGLGTARGDDAGGGLKRRQQLVAVAGRFHRGGFPHVGRPISTGPSLVLKLTERKTATAVIARLSLA
jgi:hypothetical protein